MEKIKYFDHPYHVLSLSNKKRGDQILCEACREYCDGQAYVCSREYCDGLIHSCSEGCRYSLHVSCAKLPQHVQSPFHPPHPLTLKPHDPYHHGDLFKCDGCTKHYKGFVYRCEDCNFQLDRECAFMTVKVIEEGGQWKEQLLTHPYHHHPLLLLDKVPANERYKRTVCLAHCSDHHHSTYGCIPCRLIIHDGSCFERKLPPQIQHFYHPHPLTLSTALSDQEDNTCKACYEKFTRVWYYSCEQCKDFVMDIPCTLLLPTTIDCIKPESDQIQHFLHGHPLSLRKADDQEQVMHCRVCDKRCTGPTYVCDSGRASSLFCKKIYFHKSCLEFPQQICHPFHPYHPLTLLDGQSNYSDDRCNACRKSTTDYFLYICLYCDFIISNNKPRHFCLHVECSTMMMPAITYEGHTHLLQFRDDNIESNKLQCSACKSNICESYDFNCLYCDLNLHLSCGPLPYTVKHKDHNIHSLFLTNSPLQEEVEDETDEFYCHACEEERDPQLPVYYCAECHYVAEIQCVFSQVT